MYIYICILYIYIVKLCDLISIARVWPTGVFWN